MDFRDATPRWVYRQTATHDGEGAPLFYVVCEASLDGDPERDGVPGTGDVEAGWFAAPPDELVNPTVVRDRFTGEAGGSRGERADHSGSSR